MDKKEFVALIKSNQNLIYKICNSYCKDVESRQDLQQEILLHLWQSIKKFDDRVKISTWIYRISLNTAISFYRKNHRQKHKKHVPTSAAILLPEEEFLLHEQKDHIQKLYEFIDSLGELDKALMLLYLDDIKYAEIAAILGISETNVATKINRIKKSLKKYFHP